MTYFRRKPVASRELLHKALELYESPERGKLNIEIGVQFPLSQVVDPTAPIIDNQFDGGQFEETIPLVVLSPFPRGRLLVAVFDDEDARNRQELVSFIRAQGVPVIKVTGYGAIDVANVFSVINGAQGIQEELARHPVGYQHAEALEILRDREKKLGAHNPFMTLNEVRCSSVGYLSEEGVWSSDARHERDIWFYIKQTSFDILVFDKDSLEPVLAVEYDGDHHNDDDQKAKDRFKNEFCAAIRLPLLRIDERFITPDESDLKPLTQELLKMRFRQGLLFRFLGHARRQLHKQQEINGHLEKYQRRGLEGVELAFAALDEMQESEDLFSYMVREDRRELVAEYRDQFAEEPDVSYKELAESRVQGILQWGKCKLETPCGVNLQAFGLTGIPLDQVAKDFMFDWLVETRLAFHYQDSSRPRRA